MKTTIRYFSVVLILGIIFLNCDKNNPAKPEKEELPEIVCSQKSINFSGDKLSSSVYIANNGEGKLIWSVLNKPNWVRLSKSSGSTNYLDTLIINAVLEKLQFGSYSDTIRIDSNGGFLKIGVNFDYKVEELGLIRKWNLFSGMYYGDVLDSLSGYYKFEQSGTYLARIEKDNYRGSISGCAFTKNGSISGTIKFDSPSQMLLNGMTGGYSLGPNGNIQNYWSSNISFSNSAFNQYGGTGLGWPPTENFKFTISGDTLTISKSDESTILTYLADQE